MEIKLKARLSAYSKIDFPGGGSIIPSAVTKAEIDSLFEDLSTTRPVTHDEIDTLFQGTTITRPITRTEIDSLFPEEPSIVGGPRAVSKAAIDSLFE